MIRDSNSKHKQTTTNKKLIHTNKIAQNTTLTSNHIPSSHMYL